MPPPPRRCPDCGRAMAPHETECEGCALARVMGPRGARRFGRAAVVFAVVAATAEMALLLWLLYR